MALDTTQPAVREELAELALLFEVSQALEQSVDLRDVVTPVLQAIAKHSAMQRCMLTLFKKDTGDIWIDAAEGLSPRQRQKGRYKLGEGIIGRVVQTGKALVVPRISEEPLFLDRTGARENLRKQDISYVCVPIKLGNEVIGTLSADQPFAGQASLSEDARLLSVVATLVAQAVKLRLSIEEQRKALVDENIRLHEELRDRFRPSNIIGNSRVMHAVYDQIAQVCKSDATVLVLGESGTGKE
ncbi:GAF domain-containing protein, partial [bacterium]|nr:GAF domain-containing protein [bacterium]